MTKAGSGIGRATTLKPLKEGANVLAIDRNEEGLNQTLELTGLNAERCKTKILDITERSAPKLVIESCKRNFGKISISISWKLRAADSLLPNSS